MFVKIMLSSLFFAIIYDTMQKVGYIRFGAQPDLTTVISLIFLFGPPRLVEALLATEFTGRVHMKEKEIKEELETIKMENDTKKQDSIKIMSIHQPRFTEEEKKGHSCFKKITKCWRRLRPGKTRPNETYALEEEVLDDSANKCCDYKPLRFCLSRLSIFFCGCCNFPFDSKGNCKCCVVLVTVFESEEESDTLKAESEYCKILTKNLTIPCFCMEDCLQKVKDETTEEEVNLLNELRTVDTVDEIRPRTIYKVKAEVIYDGNTELKITSNSDKSDENKEQNGKDSNKSSCEKSEEIVNKGLEIKTSTKTKSKGLAYEKNAHYEGKIDDNAGNARALDTVNKKNQQHDISNSNETGDEQSEKIVNESFESGACAKAEKKYRITAIIEPDRKPVLIKKENDDHLEN